MPIISSKPTSTVQPIVTSNPTIEPENYNSTIVDNTLIPLNSLISYVEGMPWSVNYYSQILTSNSDLKEQDLGQANIYQQYSKISQMEIRVTQAIQGTQNTETAQMTVGGTALVYPFLTPNVGDMFTADAGYGNTGIYAIKSVERKSFNKQSVYSIDYTLWKFVTSTSPELQDLDGKVTTNYTFDKSRLMEGLNPTLNTGEYANSQALAKLYSQIVSYYFKTFYYKDFDTLIIPGQGTGTYDAFVVDYILKIVQTLDAYEIRFVRNYATDEEPFLAQDQFWKVLLNRDPSMLSYCNRQMGLTYTKYFNYNSMFKGLRFSRLTYIVYPLNPDFSIFSPNDINKTGDPLLLDFGVFQDNVFTASPIFKPQATESITEAPSSGGALADLINNTCINNNVSMPVINPVINKDNFYIFSRAFYEQQSGQTLLESLTSDYINGNALDLTDLVACTQRYKAWGRLEQFYYLPILITLIKSSIAGLY